jgi:uncharacterized protein (DUF2249 family)
MGAPRITLDAEVILAGGEHPLASTRRALAQLAPGEVLNLLSAFRPEPLLAQMRQDGLPSWCEQTGEGRFATWVLKA